MPGWGLTVLLPQAIGVRRAREMSFTGNFMLAEEALAFGLVNHVVPHVDLMPYTRSIALDIIGNEQDGVRQIRSTYAGHAAEKKKWERESEDGRAWRKAQFDPKKVEERRAKIMERGRKQ
jgi:enoyl-CoA hydratase